MMNSRVKKGNNMKNKNVNGSGDHLPSIKESRSPEGESEEKASVDEILDGEESNAGNKDSRESFFPWKEELESLVHGGVPKDLRGEVWQAFMGVKARRVERYYEELLAQENDDQHSNSSGVFSKWRKQIEKDLMRTFPGHPTLNRDSLRRLLLAYARHNPSVGYCQAMNFFAGLLLLVMPEENAFWALVTIIDDFFDGYHSEGMIEYQVDQLVFDELMRERFPKLVNHLDYLGVQVAWICAPWLLSIFINTLPWESVLRIWDVLLLEGNRVMLFRTALALLELYGPALITTKDAGVAINLLQSLVGSTFDSSQLVLTACMGFLAVTDSKLRKLRDKHRPSVLLDVEERTKRSRFSEALKGLAYTRYCVKNEPVSLLEEAKPAEDLADGDESKLESHSSYLDQLLCSLNADLVGSQPDIQEQVDWMKVELCRLLEDKRAAVLQAEELETTLVELVKEDNRRLLSAKVLARMEQEQRITEDARRNVEKDAAAQRFAVTMLQEKYEKAMDSIARMEKRVIMAESMLEATLQYESGQAEALSSPRTPHATLDSPRRKAGLLSFGLGWRDKNKPYELAKLDFEESTEQKSDPSTTQEETNSVNEQTLLN
ncbi:Run and tbc1 domain containing 3 [Hibiscus syriacus]|uniref:Run and tbc1 domain containing 3 n=1 Tax=Hibiscus syriacus TaxID=106335 RepID=A0A6A3BPF5_HIBSY|nr:Run and tbc1 domain containing 3 [Hibiscus syriacus]